MHFELRKEHFRFDYGGIEGGDKDWTIAEIARQILPGKIFLAFPTSDKSTAKSLTFKKQEAVNEFLKSNNFCFQVCF